MTRPDSVLDVPIALTAMSMSGKEARETVINERKISITGNDPADLTIGVDGVEYSSISKASKGGRQQMNQSMSLMDRASVFDSSWLCNSSTYSLGSDLKKFPDLERASVIGGMGKHLLAHFSTSLILYGAHQALKLCMIGGGSDKQRRVGEMIHSNGVIAFIKKDGLITNALSRLVTERMADNSMYYLNNLKITLNGKSRISELLEVHKKKGDSFTVSVLPDYSSQSDTLSESTVYTMANHVLNGDPTKHWMFTRMLLWSRSL